MRRLVFVARVFFAGASSLWLSAQAAPSPGVAPAPDRAAVKRLFDPWRPAVPPHHLIANIHYVGAVGVSSFLITTPDGHFLLDTGFDDTVPTIERGVRELGFKLEEIKFILSSHAQIDHVGCHAAMRRLTVARPRAQERHPIHAAALDVA